MNSKILVKLDFFFNKALPKKLIVWVVATVLVFLGKVDGYVWGIVTGVYLGVNIIGKFSPIAKKMAEGDNGEGY